MVCTVDRVIKNRVPRCFGVLEVGNTRHWKEEGITSILTSSVWLMFSSPFKLIDTIHTNMPTRG